MYVLHEDCIPKHDNWATPFPSPLMFLMSLNMSTQHLFFEAGIEGELEAAMAVVVEGGATAV